MTRCQTHSQMRLSLGKKVDDKVGTWRRCRGNRGSKETVFLMISIKSTNPKYHEICGFHLLPPPKKKKENPPQKKVRVKESPENMFERGKPLRIGWSGEKRWKWSKRWATLAAPSPKKPANIETWCLYALGQIKIDRGQVAEFPQKIRKICLYSIVQLSSQLFQRICEFDQMSIQNGAY